MADAGVVIKMDLVQFYLNENTADVFFLCKNGTEKCNDELENYDNVIKEKIPAHKTILASVSSVFYAMFYGQLPEKTEIEITDVTAGGLKQFLSVIYKQEFICTIDYVHEVLYLLEKYDISGCSLACCKFLIQSGCEYFKTTNFLNCSQTILLAILQNVYLKGEGEILFKACMDWAENACNIFGLDGNIENRRKVLGNCLDFIEFASINREKTLEYLKDHGSLFKVNESTFERIKAYDDRNSRWPCYTSTTTVVFEKGVPTYITECKAKQNCLLHKIGFSMLEERTNLKNFTLVVSIEKVEGTDNHQKRKIFVGTLLFDFEYVVDNGNVIFSATLPDVVVIDSIHTYVIEIIPLEDTTIYRVNVMDYKIKKGFERKMIVFRKANFAILKITPI